MSTKEKVPLTSPDNIARVQTLESAMWDLVNNWDESLDEGYPFHMSFDELTSEVANWRFILRGDTYTPEKQLELFEIGFAQEMNGWMWNFLVATSFVCNKIIDGTIKADADTDLDSPEMKELITKLATELDAEDPDEEAIYTNIDVIQTLSSGDEERIGNELLVDFNQDKDFKLLTLNDIKYLFRGKMIDAAKAVINAGNVLSKEPLTYPHS